jgi:hypothetical protein
MTVSAQVTVSPAIVGNGVTTVFPFAFYIRANADLVVTVDGIAQLLDVDYAVSGAGNPTGGSVTFVTAPASGELVGRYRLTILERDTDYQDQGDFLAPVVNADFDSVWYALQDLISGGLDIANVIRVPPGESLAQLPSASARASQLLGFDSLGNLSLNVPVDGTAASLALALASFALLSEGAGMVGYSYGLVYGANTIGKKLLERVSVKDAGAVGDGVASDGVAVRAAVASFSVLGGMLHLPRGTYDLDASGGKAIAIDAPVSITGDGGTYAALNPSLAAVTDNTIAVSPSTLYDHSLQSIEKLALHDPTTGTRVGLTGVFLDTQGVGKFLPQFVLRDVIIGQGSSATGWGVHHLNSGNVNGGMYSALFENNAIKGGVKLEGSGDSISLVHNTISGTRLGVNASLTAGASLLEIQANNITTSEGAIKIDSGSRFRVLGNNIEHSSAGAVANNNSAIVNVNGATGAMYGGVIKENLISGFAPTDATILLRVRNCRGTLIEDNVFLNGGASTTGIDIGSDCSDIRVGANSFNAAVTTQVTDAGVGTMGVVKTPALQNGWVAYSVSTSTLKYMKSGDGMVHVWGSLKSGTLTNGILVATLGLGFRPSELHRAPCFADNAGTRSMAEVTVETDGTLRFTYAQTTQMSFNFSFPALNLAHSISLE